MGMMKKKIILESREDNNNIVVYTNECAVRVHDMTAGARAEIFCDICRYPITLGAVNLGRIIRFSLTTV
jgi:hypothetical protein